MFPISVSNSPVYILQISFREVEIIKYKLREQENRCKSLETALRQHHKQSEKLIQSKYHLKLSLGSDKGAEHL